METSGPDGQESDRRGTGGVQRGHASKPRSTPGKLFSYLTSPLTAAVRTVGKAFMGTAAREPSPLPAQRGTPPSPLPPAATPVGVQAVLPLSPVLAEANAKFGSPEFSSPPSASNARTPAVTLPAFDQPAEASMPTPPSQHANVHADAPVEIGAAAQSQAGPSNLQKEMLANWSPNKLASLQFFLKSDKAVAAAAPSVAPEPARPYLGLKYLLSAGPNGMNNPDVGLGGAMGSAAVAAGNAVPAPTSHALPPRPLATSNRFNPYRRPEQSARPTMAGNAGGFMQLPRPSMPPAVFGAAAPPRPPPGPSMGAYSSVPASAILRLAPGQVAVGAGRSVTPLPKFGIAPPPGPLPKPAMVQPSAQPAASTGGAAATGMAGSKRPRDTPPPSPLVASGIKNLSEFKRRKQAVAGSTPAPKSILASLPVRTPRDVGTPLPALSPLPTPLGTGAAGSGMPAEPPRSETARRILETIESMKRSDATHKARASPSGLAGPSGAAVAPTGPGLSPLPSWMPPLGRLAEQVNAATASPSTSMLRTGTPSLTPLPLSNTVNAGHTPGPQKVLSFSSPSPSPTFSAIPQGNPKQALPLSPLPGAEEAGQARKEPAAGPAMAFMPLASGSFSAGAATGTGADTSFSFGGLASGGNSTPSAHGSAKPSAADNAAPSAAATAFLGFGPTTAAVADSALVAAGTSSKSPAGFLGFGALASQPKTDSVALLKAKQAAQQITPLEQQVAITGQQFSFSDPEKPADATIRQANEQLKAGAGAGSTAVGVPSFTFTAPQPMPLAVTLNAPATLLASTPAADGSAPTSGVHSSTLAITGGQSPSGPPENMLAQVQAAAAVPLPSDDDDIEPVQQQQEAQATKPPAQVTFALMPPRNSDGGGNGGTPLAKRRPVVFDLPKEEASQPAVAAQKQTVDSSATPAALTAGGPILFGVPAAGLTAGAGPAPSMAPLQAFKPPTATDAAADTTAPAAATLSNAGFSLSGPTAAIAGTAADPTLQPAAARSASEAPTYTFGVVGDAAVAQPIAAALAPLPSFAPPGTFRSSASAVPNSFTFGLGSGMNASMAGYKDAAASFGFGTCSSAPALGASLASPMFGSASAQSAAAPVPDFSAGFSAGPSAISAPAFAGFGVSISGSGFGAMPASAPSFGFTSGSRFAASDQQQSAPFMFGASAATAQTNMFGTTQPAQGFGGMSAAVAAPSFLGAPTPTAGQTQPSNFFSLQQAPQPSFNAGPVFGSGMQANPFGNPGAPASQPVDGGLFMFGQAQGTAGAGAPPMFGGLSMFSQGAAAPDAGAAGGFSLGAGGGEGGAAGRKKFRARRAGG